MYTYIYIYIYIHIILLSGGHRHRDLAVLVPVHHARVEFEEAPNLTDEIGTTDPNWNPR